MKKKFFRRFVAVLSAMVTAVTMMATSASAKEWSVYRQNRGNGTYSTYATYEGYLQTLGSESKVKVNCPNFATSTGSKAKVRYWSIVTTDEIASQYYGMGFTEEYFTQPSSVYLVYTLETPVRYGLYLQFRASLTDYSSTPNCSMSGNYLWA